MKKDFENKFEQENLDKQIKKMKRKSMIKTLSISLIVSIVVIVGALFINTSVNIRESEKSFEREQIYTQLTVPNGYILDATFDFEMLGGKSEYTIAREIGPKSVTLTKYKSQYGKFFKINSMYYGSGFRYDRNFEEADGGFWDTGYRKMIFYHPSIEYKGYKNDLELLEEIPDGKIIEMGISFDKDYSVWDIDKILPDVETSWIGLDMFTDEYMKNEKYEAKEYDMGAVYIDEREILGVSMLRVNSTYEVQFEVSNLLDLLKESPMEEHHKIYEKYYTEDRTDMPNMIAAIVYGTKDELMKLRDNPYIKASSIGVVEDLY